jgi:hypothetical protein
LIELDDYERKFIAKKTEASPDAEDIIVDVLKLFDNCIRKNLSRLKSCIQDVEIKKLVDFMDRSKVYEEFISFWSKRFFQEIDEFEFSKINFLHIFLPILLQEIEGPLKRQLLMVNFLLEICKGSDVDWSEYIFKEGKGRKYPKFVRGIVEKGFKLTEHYSEIRNIYFGLKAEENRNLLSLVRNCVAHSDYKVEETDKDLRITFPDPNGEDQNFTFEHVWKLSSVFDLILILHVALHLGIRRAEK